MFFLDRVSPGEESVNAKYSCPVFFCDPVTSNPKNPQPLAVVGLHGGCFYLTQNLFCSEMGGIGIKIESNVFVVIASKIAPDALFLNCSISYFNA
jgi:hypothetical protein